MKTKIVILLLILFIVVVPCYSQAPNNEIVLVNVGSVDRGAAAKGIEIISELNPKVISLDLAFPHYTGDADDKSLYRALRNVKTLVMPSEIVYEGRDYQDREMISVYLTSAAEFFVSDAKSGFVSAMVEKGQIEIPKQFIVWQKGSYSEDVYHHFSIVTAMAFDSLKASRFIQSHERLVSLEYEHRKRKFRTFSVSDVLNGKLTRRDIEGRIVMIGFLGPGNQDKFFTPMNTDPNEPDMYGLEYLANIVAQVLEK